MAYDHGCTFFDTAEIYSPELAGIGHNERIVGRALEGCDAVIATKLHLNAPEVRRRGLEEAVRSHLAGSIERLRIDHLPLYYLHRVNTDIPLEDVAALAELPSKEVLQAQALGMMLAPITSLAIVLKAIAEKNGEPAEAEAPAAE